MTIRCRYLVVVLFVAFVFTQASRAETNVTPSSEYDAANSDCGEDNVWLISTRHLPAPRCRFGGEVNLAAFRLQNGCFVPSSVEEYLASRDGNSVDCVYVHGNRMSPADARQRGLALRQRLNCRSGRCRFVIWSWPSERIPGPVRDARTKAARADGEAFYLASFLALFPPDARVDLIGYSFGARTLTGSLQLLAGGSFSGNRLAAEPRETMRPRVVLMAAAIPRNWLLPGSVHGLVPVQAERIALFFNPRDPVLKHFEFVLKTGRTPALGFEGIAARQLGSAASTLDQFNVSGSVGRSHSFDKYLNSASIMRAVRGQMYLSTVQ